jgi:hypothetical protein
MRVAHDEAKSSKMMAIHGFMVIGRQHIKIPADVIGG